MQDRGRPGPTSGLTRHIDEPAAIVAEQVIRQEREALGCTIIIDLLLLVPAEARVLGIPLQVVADVEVEVAVAVQVGEGGRGGLVTVISQADCLGHIAKGPVPLVAIEGVGAPAGDEQVGMAVVVIITHRQAMPIAPREDRDTGRGGGVREGAVTLIAEEAVAGARGLRVGGEGTTLDQVDVESAVAVVVE
jgi:hypothetical protein